MKNRKLLLLVFLCSFLLGLRTYSYLTKLDRNEEKLTNQSLVIQTDSVRVDGNFLKLIGKIKDNRYLIYYSLKTSEEKELWQGKEIPNTAVISGEVESFEAARNLHGFDQKKYYQSLGISRLIQVESWRPFKRNERSPAALRYHLIWRIDQHYSSRLASYIKALVIGYKDAQFTDYSAVYKENGLLHLFTLSGLHIQFYLGAVHLLLKRLGAIRELRLILLTVLGIILIPLTGGNFSTIRAVVSFLITFGCLTFELFLSKLDQWSIMVFLLVFCFPLVFWSVGTQLSLYFALLLLYLNDLHLKKWQQMLLFSMLTLPLLLYSFSEWSAAGGLFTLLLFPVFEWLILPGCLLLFFGCFLPIPTFFSQMFERIFQLLERGLASFVFPNLTFGRPTFLSFIFLLISVFLIIDRIKYRQKFLWLFGVSAMMILSISFSANGMVAFVDVGQGDSIFIKLPFKQETFLIDTGGRLNFKREKWQTRQQKPPSDYNLLPLLKALGCTRIDHLLITHNDADHMGELVHVLNEIKVTNLYLAKGSQSELRSILEPMRTTKIHLVKKGDTIGERLRIQVLFPETSQGENDDSLVTYFRLNQQRFLLTGDLETTGEEKLLKAYPQLKTDFLKIGHHGSNTSTGEEFLKQTQPKYGIISAGKRNRYGHPTQETLNKLAKYRVKTLRTDQQGMIYYQWSALTRKEEIKVLIDFLD